MRRRVLRMRKHSYPYKTIDEEGFLVKKRLAVWIKKWMMYSNAEAKNFAHLFVAAPKAVYKISNYEDYLPIQVKENYEQFVDEFISRHKRANPTLHKNHVKTKLSIFICGLDLFEPEQITHHCREIHGLERGITCLSPLLVIKVKDGVKFTSPSLLEIKNMGEDNQAMLAENLYHRCVASGILISTNSNMNTADLKSHRAQELIEGIKEVSDKIYFKRFLMFLGQALREQGQNVTGSFSCKWVVIQNALFSAIGDDRNVNRMLIVKGLEFKDFSGQPLETLFYEVEKKVDDYMGTREDIVRDTEMRPQCLYTYTLYMKFNLIIDIAINLDESFNAIRICILKKISLFYFDPTKLMGITHKKMHPVG